MSDDRVLNLPGFINHKAEVGGRSKKRWLQKKMCENMLNYSLILKAMKAN